MRNAFFGYYPPTLEEYDRLWTDAIIVPDANVLLDLYRVPTTARDALLNVLELFKHRLWIPYQVALEFQRNRLTVMSSGRKQSEEVLKLASDAVDNLKTRVESLQIEKYGLGLDAGPIIEELTKANANLLTVIQSVHNAQLEIAATDPIRERLDHLFADRVGTGPSNQDELDELTKDGDTRYAEKIPPGFGDLEKGRNPHEATFVHDHLKYQRKYGDLILWRQLIKHVRDNKIPNILFVTSERYDDWWWREQGKTIGAHPDLVREIRRDGGAELFWIYSSAQFLEHAAKYSKTEVSKATVEELKELSVYTPELSSQENVLNFGALDLSDVMLPELAESNLVDIYSAKKAVFYWLRRNAAGRVEFNQDGFPDYIVEADNVVQGYDVKYVKAFSRILVTPPVINSMLKGYLEMNEGRLSQFFTVVIISGADFYELVRHERVEELRQRLSQLINRYPVSGMIVGAVIGQDFRPLARVNSSVSIHRRGQEDSTM